MSWETYYRVGVASRYSSTGIERQVAGPFDTEAQAERHVEYLMSEHKKNKTSAPVLGYQVQAVGYETDPDNE
jgi:hypothetical protein